MLPFMNVFFALKGSKPLLSLLLVLCRVVAIKSLPALIYNADYILLFGPLRSKGVF